MRARCHGRDTQRVAAASALGRSLRGHCPGGSWPSMAASPSHGTRDMSGSGGGSSSGQGCHPKEATVASVSPDWEELQRGQDKPCQLHAQTLASPPGPLASSAGDQKFLQKGGSWNHKSAGGDQGGVSRWAPCPCPFPGAAGFGTCGDMWVDGRAIAGGRCQS